MDTAAYIKLWNSAHVRIMDIRRQNLQPGKTVPALLLPSSAYLYVTEGSADIRMDGKSWMAGPYSVVHGGKGAHLAVRPEEALSYYLILYKASLPVPARRDLSDLLTRSNPFQSQYVLQASQPLYLLDKAQRMLERWQAAGDLDKLMAQSLFIQFVHEIMGQLGRQQLAAIRPDPVSQSIRYMEEHYREPISLELLGELLHCSPRQLLRKFRDKQGLSPIDYLIGIRLRKAKQLLAGTQAQLKEIAESVGYADSYYFSRLFKKHEGLSPGRYRELYRPARGGERPHYPLAASLLSIAAANAPRYSDNEFDNHYHYRGEGDSTMNYRSRRALAALVICLSLLLGACGSAAPAGSPADASASPAAAAAQTAQAGTNAADVSRTIKHAMGETTLKGAPERIVILTNEGTEALLALGVKPVGAVQSWYQKPWYKHIEGDMRDVTVVGDELQPNIELIASLKPDLIIGNKVRQEKIYEQLKQIAPTVFSEDLAGDWKINFTLYSEALNLEEQGKKMMEAFDQRVKEAKAKLAGKLDTKVSVVRFSPTQVRIYQKQTFSGVLLEQLGFARPAAQDKDNFIEVMSKETIPDMDGDVMFYFATDTTGDNKVSKVVEEWMNDPLFKNLNVSKNNKVVQVDEAVWNTAGGYEAANLLLDEIVAYFEKH
ncbi:AraC family transcriptional regulator [Paenibacillus sp. YN15]|uniref:AraC family transcriptional regulator n=1 Tax=Paenibacillus sp. YN15 TaxID=1742774 RepID=UPI00215C858B|nr:AraC family transcriptional regulator [Paenibacillus sp. YN15]